MILVRVADLVLCTLKQVPPVPTLDSGRTQGMRRLGVDRFGRQRLFWNVLNNSDRVLYSRPLHPPAGRTIGVVYDMPENEFVFILLQDDRWFRSSI